MILSSVNLFLEILQNLLTRRNISIPTGMEIGGFASLMVHGLLLEASQLLARLTTIAQLCKKVRIFFSTYKKTMEVGERAIFHAPIRNIYLLKEIDQIWYILHGL